MNSRLIKIIAVVAMTVDHVGALLFPEIDALRIIGRIAMPLFCLLIAFGVTKTRNPLKYFLRLFVFAVAVQIGFTIFNTITSGNSGYNETWNVFFTLAFGVAAAWLLGTCIKIAIDKSEMPLGRFVQMAASFMGAAALVLAAQLLPFDYGSAGVVLVVLFYLALRHSVLAMKITAAAALAVFNLVLCFAYVPWPVQWWSFLALPFVWLFTDKKLKISPIEKYAFYIYYPLHFAVIYLVGSL